MAKPGAKGKSKQIHEMTGTQRKDRVSIEIVPPIPARNIRPKGLIRNAGRIFDEKLEIYTARGQSIAGCESLLVQYCNLEATLLSLWRNKQIPTMAQMTEYRRLADTFFDSPARQLSRPKKNDSKNPFSKHSR